MANVDSQCNLNKLGLTQMNEIFIMMFLRFQHIRRNEAPFNLNKILVNFIKEDNEPLITFE